MRFNIYVLRRLYNPQQKGSGTIGQTTREPYKTTLTLATKTALGKAVPLGPGQYGASVTELGIRLLLALTDSISDKNRVFEELTLSVVDRETLVSNLDAARKFVVAYTSTTRGTTITKDMPKE